MAIKLALLVVFFGIMLAVGIHCRRHATDVNGFVLGGRSVGAWLTAFAYGTSYFSAVIFVGYAGQFGWRFGVASTWIGLGNAFLGSLLAWVVLGRRTRLMSQHLDSATMPEFFGKRFGSRGLKIGASIIVFIFLIPYTASLYNGLSRLFGMAFNIDYTLCIILMAALTCVYVVAGGYMATAINDFIQGLIMLGGIVVVVLAVLNENGGFMAAMDALARVEDASVTPRPARSPPSSAPSRWSFSAWSSSPRWAPGGFRRWCRNSTPSARKRPSTRARSSPRCLPWSWRAAATSSAASAGSTGTA